MTITIQPRSAWGARDPERRSALKGDGYGWIIHCNGPAMSGPVEARIRGIQAYHMDEKGWSDIAYNFVVLGTEVWDGRGFGIIGGATGSPYDQGSHSIIVPIGNYQDVPDGTEDTILALIAEGVRRGWKNTKTSPHNAYANKDCPGKVLSAWIKAGSNPTGDTPMAKTIEVPDPHMQQIQEALTAAGYQPGVIDGIPGPKSLAAVLDVIGERNVARSNATALEQARATAEKALVATRNERDQLRDTVDQATTLLDNAGYETGSGVAAGIGRVLDHVLDLQREARDLRAQLEETVPLELESGPSNRQVSLEVAARTLAATDFDPERMAVALGQVKGVAEQYVAWLESE